MSVTQGGAGIEPDAGGGIAEDGQGPRDQAVMAAEFAAELDRDRKQLLLKSIRSTTVATLVSVAMIAAVFWSHANHFLMAAWAMGTIGVGIFRYLVIKPFRDGCPDEKLERAHRLTMTGTVLAALMWILGLPLFIGENLVDMMVPAFLYVILCCAGTISLSVYKRAFLVFIPPILLCVMGAFAYRAAVDPGNRGYAIGIAVALLSVTAVLFRLMRQTDEQLTHNLVLNYQNARLVGGLKDAQGRTEEDKLRQMRRREELETLASRFQERVSGITGRAATASEELIASAGSTNERVRFTLGMADQVSEGTREVSDRIRGLSAAAEQLASSIDLVNRDVGSAAGIARDSVSELERANDTVQSLADASQRVGEIVGLITVIARQTNLLALNASIEAERAGEAGRGFAVVAGEVKNLASQTAHATREVTEHIANIRATTENVTSVIRTIGETILKVNDIAERVVASVHEQSDTTSAISRDLNRVSGETAEVSERVVKLHDAASQAAAAAESMSSAVGTLTQAAQQTTGEIRQFLVGVQQQP